MIKKTFAVTLLGTLVIFGGISQANAETLTVSGTLGSSLTDINTTVGVEKFNSSLGQLTSVSITLSTGASTAITLTNDSPSASSGNVYDKVVFALADPSSLLGLTKTLQLGVTSTIVEDDVVTYVGTSYSLASGASTVISANKSGSTTQAFSTQAILNEFTATSTELINFTLGTTTTTVQSNTGGNTSTDQDTYVTSTVTVTYTYTPTAVPEPSTWAMIFGGIGTLALVQRRRRRTV